ncbi:MULTISPECIES: carboxypeptidase regulatory-like domain-containing protein [unclassified Corynebacterium]|uniref:carboxypeptidase regulatory-like domain-containing protein n=1 Tax=unclassified Corynebacterium TaxID=2624378 RepID=UPI001EF4F196|nr:MULTISPECIES: carboxypeptidase regulatory-like domain-containing protein [unclassified Corynebacterium]MCG7288585.1 carboxypeptidase regulatory-like domain-containing protein [Corynebacterium sp. ACRPZ]MCG7293109.1 carboxypeptidase regulatory-like domain-containing protein [Corynebacterium sp. ACRPY]
MSLPGNGRVRAKRITAVATALALAGGAAEIPLGPAGSVAHAQIAPTQQPGISFGSVNNLNGDWEASVFFESAMTVRTVSIDFVPADSTNPREEAPADDPVFTRIPEVAEYRVDHMKRTQVLASYDVTARRTQSTSTSGHPSIRITYELPGVEVGQGERLALFAPGKGAQYPTPLRGGGARFTRPTVNADIRGSVTMHEATADEYKQAMVEIRQGAETFTSPVQADGTYEIAVPSPSGTMEINVIPPAGFVTPEPKTWEAAEGLAAPDFDVYPITVSGTVLDASETPVQGAKVTIAGREATTDQGGNFTVAKVPAGTHALLIGETTTTEEKPVSGVVVNDQRDNNIGQQYVNEKQQFGTVSGRVTDPSGGVAGVTVTIGGKSATTNSDGSYTVEDVPAGEQPVVVDGPDGYTVEAPSSVEVKPDGSTDSVDVKLTPNDSPVSGRITDNKGNGVGGVTVTIGGKSATTNSDGSYTVEDVPAGNQSVVVDGPDGYTVEAPSSVEVKPDGSTDSVDVKLTLNDSAVSGQITDADGNGVGGVTVTIGGKSATTNPDGSYTVEDVPAGNQPVVVDGPDGYTVEAPSSVEVKPDGSTPSVDVKLIPNPVAPTTSAQPTTSEPKPSPTTSVQPTTPKPSPTTIAQPTTSEPKPSPTTSAPAPKPSPTTSAQPTTSKPTPPPTSTTLKPSPKPTTSAPTPTPKPTTSAPAPTTSEMPRLTTRPTPTPKPAPKVGSVAGKVTDPAGKAVPGATVTARDARGKTHSVPVAADGKFQLTDLPPGDYTVTVNVPEGHVAPPPANVTVKAGEQVQLPGFVVNPEKPKAQFNWDRVVVKPGQTQVTAPTRTGDTTTPPNFRTSTVTQVKPDGTTTELPAEESWISVEGDGTVVARPPRNAEPGEYRVEVQDDSGETHTITVEVDEPTPMAQQHEVRFPLIPVPAGATRQAGRPRATVTDGPFVYADRRLPEGTRFVVDPAYADWVRVDNNGRLTFTPPKDAAPGIRKIPVKVTFPDGSSRTYIAEVEIGDPFLADTTELGYEEGLSVPPGEGITVLRTGAAVLPEGTTFEVDRSQPLGDWVAIVDEHTGNLRVFAPQQGEVKVPVIAYFADGSSAELTASVRVSTSSALSAAHSPSYADVSAAPGGTATVKLSGSVPAGTTFAVVDGGGLRNVGVDRRTGSLKIKLPADAQLDTPYTVTVRVRYADGSTEEITAQVTAASDAARFTPRVAGVTAEVGEAATVRTGLNHNAKLAEFDHDGWQVFYDRATGELTAKPNSDVPVGTVLKVPMKVTFPDGSTKIVEYAFTATDTPAPAVKQNRTSSGSSDGSSIGSSAGSSDGSSASGGWIAVVLGLLAMIAGVGYAAFLNQDAIRAQLKHYGF